MSLENAAADTSAECNKYHKLHFNQLDKLDNAEALKHFPLASCSSSEEPSRSSTNVGIVIDDSAMSVLKITPAFCITVECNFFVATANRAVCEFKCLVSFSQAFCGFHARYGSVC